MLQKNDFIQSSCQENKIVNGNMNFYVKWQPVDENKQMNAFEESKDEINEPSCSIKNPASGVKRIFEFSNTSVLNISMDEIYGNFECDDKPKTILKIRKLSHYIEFLVDWLPRENGYQPKESVVTNKEMRKYSPEFLIDFYETKIEFEDEE